MRGDDNYDWWKLGEEEYVREDVVETTHSCDDIQVGYEVEHEDPEAEMTQEESEEVVDLSQFKRGDLVPLTAWLYESPALSSSIAGICQSQEVVIVDEPNAGFYEVLCDGQSGFLEVTNIQFREDAP